MTLGHGEIKRQSEGKKELRDRREERKRTKRKSEGKYWKSSPDDYWLAFVPSVRARLIFRFNLLLLTPSIALPPFRVILDPRPRWLRAFLLKCDLTHCH